MQRILHAGVTEVLAGFLIRYLFAEKIDRIAGTMNKIGSIQADNLLAIACQVLSSLSFEPSVTLPLASSSSMTVVSSATIVQSPPDVA